MNYFYLFLAAGTVIVLLILQYDKHNRKKVNNILRANKNVPPLFMLRSAELKVNAIKLALSASGFYDAEVEEKKKVLSLQLDKLIEGYKNRDIALAAYYAKLGALLISVNELKTAAPTEVHVHA